MSDEMGGESEVLYSSAKRSKNAGDAAACVAIKRIASIFPAGAPLRAHPIRREYDSRDAKRLVFMKVTMRDPVLFGLDSYAYETFLA